MFATDDVHKFRRHIPDFDARIDAIARAQLTAVRGQESLGRDCVDAMVRALTSLGVEHAIPMTRSTEELLDPELRAFMAAVINVVIGDCVGERRADLEHELDPQATVVIQVDDLGPADEAHESCVRQFIRYATRAEMDQLNLALSLCARPARAHYYSTCSEIDIPITPLDDEPATDGPVS